MKRLVSLTVVALLGLTACSTSFDVTEPPADAKIALYFDNDYAGRNKLGTDPAKGLVWFIDEDGSVVGRSKPFKSAGHDSIASKEGTLFVVDADAGYTVSPDGVKAFPRKEWPVRSDILLPYQGSALVFQNSGSVVDDEPSYPRLDLANPSNDVKRTGRYVEGIAECGSGLRLYSSAGHGEYSAHWQDLEGNALSETIEGKSLYPAAFGEVWPCIDGALYGFFVNEDDEGTAIPLILSWDATTFAMRSQPLTRGGAPISETSEWREDNWNPIAYWAVDGKIKWINMAGQAWTTDPASGETSLEYEVQHNAVDPSRVFGFEQRENSFVVVFQTDEEVVVTEYALQDGAVLRKIIVDEVPKPNDMTISDVATLDW